MIYLLFEDLYITAVTLNPIVAQQWVAQDKKSRYFLVYTVGVDDDNIMKGLL